MNRPSSNRNPIKVLLGITIGILVVMNPEATGDLANAVVEAGLAIVSGVAEAAAQNLAATLLLAAGLYAWHHYRRPVPATAH